MPTIEISNANAEKLHVSHQVIYDMSGQIYSEKFYKSRYCGFRYSEETNLTYVEGFVTKFTIPEELYGKASTSIEVYGAINQTSSEIPDALAPNGFIYDWYLQVAQKDWDYDSLDAEDLEKNSSYFSGYNLIYLLDSNTKMSGEITGSSVKQALLYGVGVPRLTYLMDRNKCDILLNSVSAIVTYENATPVVSPTYPLSGASINPYSNNKFTWTHSDNATIGETTQASYVLEYRVQGEENASSVSGAASSEHTLLSRSLLEGQTYEWRVKITTSDGVESTWSDWIAFQTISFTPSVTSPVPDGNAYINPNQANTFSWFYSAGNYQDYPKQSSYEIEYRIRGTEDSTTIIGSSEKTEHVFPGSTFENSQLYEWRVKLTTEALKTSEWSEWASFSTIPLGSKSYAVSPSNVYLVSNQSITFRWIHASPTGSIQASWEIQTSQNDQEYISLASGTGSDSSYILESNSFGAGAVYWRVKTTDTNEYVGDWSDPLVFYMRIAPNPPAISNVDRKPRPTVYWQSQDQVAAEVVINSNSSGVLYGEEKSYQYPIYLPDGPVHIQVRVLNEYGLWSTWAEVDDTISNSTEGLSPIVIEGSSENGHVTVSAQTDGTFAHMYLLRNNIPILKGEPPYVDLTSIGENTYIVMGVSEDDYYILSNEIQISTDITNAMLSEIGSSDFISLEMLRGSFPTHSMEVEPLISFGFYTGSKFPIPNKSPYMNATHSFSFTFKRKEDIDRFTELIGKDVVYKDMFGSMVIGTLSPYSCVSDWYWTVSFSIVEINYSDEVAYD